VRDEREEERKEERERKGSLKGTEERKGREIKERAEKESVRR
jgi:hypothetical protein